MDMWSANRCRCSRELRPHDLEGRPPCRITIHGRNGPCSSMITNSLRTLFEGSRSTLQPSDCFAGEMERTGEKNWIWFGTSQIERISNRLRGGVGECWSIDR